MENSVVNIEFEGSEWLLDMELEGNFSVVSVIIAKPTIFLILSAVHYIAKKKFADVLCDRSHL